MAGDHISKVFDIERPFKPRGKKPSERSEQRRKYGEGYRVYLSWIEADCHSKHLWGVVGG